MLYVMPQGKWNDYKDNQYKVLSDTKDAIKARYPETDVRVDRLVVTVSYTNFLLEVQPVFERKDDADIPYYLFPDTKGDGRWRQTKPRHEMNAMKEFDQQKNRNLRRLCKMMRAWKDKHGVGMGGLLVDTLAHNFLQQNTAYDNQSYGSYHLLTRDFFEFLADQPDKNHYKALGSGQNVEVKTKFQKKASEAYDLCKAAIAASETKSENEKWRKVFGRKFPAYEGIPEGRVSKAVKTWRDTEQFIERLHPVNIQYNIELDCDVSQNGYRESNLWVMLNRGLRLQPRKTLWFTVKSCNVPQPYSLKWKVLNRGAEAEQRDEVRGQIFDDEGRNRRKEVTKFAGEHLVEVYAIKDNIVVAKARIDVPIR